MSERKIKENVVKQLTDREHCLLRPGIYIGSVTVTKANTFILDKSTDTFSYQEIEYVPGFLKIIYEVLDNSVDEAIRTGFKKATEISVSINQKTSEVVVEDNGRGIPLDTMKGSDMSMLEGALTCLRAGSNFNDDEGRNLLGMNGVGSSLSNIFSKKFVAEVYDGTRHGVLTCSDNLSKKSCVIEKKASKNTGTKISFIPDLERFGLTCIDQTHVDLVHQRLIFLSLTYPEIVFSFNGKQVKFKNAKNFMQAFSEKFVAIQDDNWPPKYLIGVIPNKSDEFNHKSYINGADCILGGNHLNVISNELVKRIREKLARKYSNIKVGDIKNRMSFIVNFREFINPMFNSQTKENFSSSESEIREFLKDVDWDAFAQKICKCNEIIEPIIESFKIKEELQNRKTLDKISGNAKKFKCKKFMPATKVNKYCLICEGDSAQAGLSEGLGRAECGFFATRGVPLNAYDALPSKIADNEELTNIIKVLNIKLNAEKQELTYENIVLASDADADGAHISTLYIGFFSKFCPSIIKAGKLKKLLTPIICMKDSKENIKEMFFTLDEYNDWLKKNKTTNLKAHYYKGLGSWEKKDLQDLVKRFGIDKFIQTLEYDENSVKLIDDWLNKKKADVRKEYLKENEFSIFSI